MGVAALSNLITNRDLLKDLFGSVPNLLGEIPIDVLVSESPVYAHDITKRPVEAGFDAADSRVARPIGVDLECIFTDPPQDAIAMLSATVAAIKSGKWISSSWREKYSELLRLDRENKKITVTTPLDTYPDLMITSLAIDRKASTSNALFFRISLEQIKTVASEIATVAPEDIPQDKEKKKKTQKAKNKDSKTQNEGTKSTETAPAKSESVLSKLGKMVGV